MFILAGNGDWEWKALDCLIYESFENKIVFSDVLMFEKFSSKIIFIDKKAIPSSIVCRFVVC